MKNDITEAENFIIEHRQSARGIAMKESEIAALMVAFSEKIIDQGKKTPDKDELIVFLKWIRNYAPYRATTTDTVDIYLSQKKP